LLASEYGWAKDYILENIYIDDVFNLQKQITRRHFEEWKMQLAIVQNPHTEKPKDLWDMLVAQTAVPDDEPLDKVAFENFKAVVSGGKHVAVK